MNYTIDGEYDVITVGSPHSEVIEMLHGLGANPSMPRFDIFSEMDSEKLRTVTGHKTIEAAKMSGARKFGDLCVIYPRADETSARAEDIDMFKQEVQKKGFTYSLGGRFHGVNKGADKGKATQIVIDLYKKKFGNVLSIGVGDAHNDLAMLAVTDQSYMVKKLDGSFEPINDPKIQKIDGIGASGWSILANRVISETNTPQNK